jgi:hypothetical protein
MSLGHPHHHHLQNQIVFILVITIERTNPQSSNITIEHQPYPP